MYYRNRRAPMRRYLILVSFVAAVASFPPPVTGQWLNYAAPGIPRTPDGKPNLSAPAPKTADGKPELSGIWSADSGSRLELDQAAALLQRPGTAPLQPWAEAVDKQRREMLLKDD